MATRPMQPDISPVVRHFYIPHPRFYTAVGTESMTKQSFKSECDIYTILKQFQRTGIISHIAQHKGSFEDLPDAMDFQDALNLVMQAEASFADLPSAVRDEFGNDPQRFLAAFADPDKEARLRELGLLQPKPESRPADPLAAPLSEGAGG